MTNHVFGEEDEEHAHAAEHEQQHREKEAESKHQLSIIINKYPSDSMYSTYHPLVNDGGDEKHSEHGCQLAVATHTAGGSRKCDAERDKYKEQTSAPCRCRCRASRARQRSRCDSTWQTYVHSTCRRHYSYTRETMLMTHTNPCRTDDPQIAAALP